ncbi:MAG TPA: alpha/beta hydrolase [Streptosporangiaceae bacterium]|nr:alpha/beta hydrolase [Streptosporangiaceae bacterium]
MTDHWVRRGEDSPVHLTVQGSGPVVLLLAGTGYDSSDWQRAGYVDALAGCFTVAALDLPGQGKTAGSADPGDYALPKLLGILDLVADHLAAPDYAVLGYSSGGSLALRAAALASRVCLAFVMAAVVGSSLDPAIAARSARQAMTVHQAKLAGTLDTLPLTPAQREMAVRLDIPAHIAWLRAETAWPPVLAADLRCPTFLYLGSADALVPAPAHLAADRLLELHLQPELDHAAVFETSEPAISAALAFLTSDQAGGVAARPR